MFRKCSAEISEFVQHSNIVQGAPRQRVMSRLQARRQPAVFRHPPFVPPSPFPTSLPPPGPEALRECVQTLSPEALKLLVYAALSY